jgi:hypothetical protein
MMHLVGDVPVLFLLAAVLIWLHPRWNRSVEGVPAHTRSAA